MGQPPHEAEGQVPLPSGFTGGGEKGGQANIISQGEGLER